jgi:hypothetical protein
MTHCLSCHFHKQTIATYEYITLSLVRHNMFCSDFNAGAVKGLLAGQASFSTHVCCMGGLGPPPLSLLSTTDSNATTVANPQHYYSAMHAEHAQISVLGKDFWQLYLKWCLSQRKNNFLIHDCNGKIS